ncbi:MAG: hypothetical protein ABW119_21925, partial [Candidatus Thiodiazotropha lotti]
GKCSGILISMLSYRAWLEETLHLPHDNAGKPGSNFVGFNIPLLHEGQFNFPNSFFVANR